MGGRWRSGERGRWRSGEQGRRRAAGGGAVGRTRYVRSGETRIGYELRGRLRRRRPWLVLIQGMGLDRRGWEGIPGKLRRRFRLVLVDNRGCGRSERPAGSFTVADMAGDVVAVLDAAGIRQAHVLGASLGGMVAQELAIRHPGAGRRPRPGLHHAGLALRLPDAGALGTADRGDRPPAGRGGVAPPHGKRPLSTDHQGPAGPGGATAGTAGRAAGRCRNAVGAGRRRGAVRRPAPAGRHPGSHAGPARRRGHGRRPAQRQAARQPHPPGQAQDLPRAWPPVLLGRAGWLRRSGNVVPYRRRTGAQSWSRA